MEKMEIEITKTEDNHLLKRKEVFFRLKHDEKSETKGASPSRAQAREVLIKKLRCKPNLLVIDKMQTEFGKRETVGYAKVYENEERLKEIEQEYIIRRNFGSQGIGMGEGETQGEKGGKEGQKE
ncbi:MAG: 30S ribosomal protein S24e [Euryarchaeota archaeon]|nr:30S ribosomal protein S24e [Euryarchaeota archaeon]